MFCIAAFIVFAVLGLFSATYRPLAKKAWHCVLRRITLRPCDISFGEEMKGRIIGKVIIRHPRLGRLLDRWIDWIAFAFVALSIWSLLAVMNSGLNLWVYDTCNPQSAESCSLSGEACGVEQESLSIVSAVEQGRVLEWALGPVTRTLTTLSRIPDRIKTWNPTEYKSATASYHAAYDAIQPTALEIVDPSCQFCAKLTGNIEQSGVIDRVNLTYLLYPIPKPDGGTKFPHSMRMAQVVEATKRTPLSGSTVPGDWQLLLSIFNAQEQERFRIGYTREQAEHRLRELLVTVGYTAQQVEQIMTLSQSMEIQNALQEQKAIVEEKVRTVKIPTLLIGGRRFDRVITSERLQQLAPQD
jgi:hypothetical protein